MKFQHFPLPSLRLTRQFPHSGPGWGYAQGAHTHFNVSQDIIKDKPAAPSSLYQLCDPRKVT